MRITSWRLLYFARTKRIIQLQVVRDSKVIIDWVSQECQLHVVVLKGWKEKIRKIQEELVGINFHHIFQEFNGDDDLLSKQAMYLTEGLLHFSKIVDSNIISKETFSIFER